MDINKRFCEECNHDVELEVKNTTLKGTLKGEEIEYKGKKIYGSDCHHEIKDSEIIKLNEQILDDTFRNYHGILSLEIIKKIPAIYTIGKRPLSIILGWGELTFTRYYEGSIPSETYANILSEIYKSPSEYLKLLEKRKDLISLNAYNKSKSTTLNLIKNNADNFDIFNYILFKCEDITQYSIHKLMYYVAGFHLAFYNENVTSSNLILLNNKLEFENVAISDFLFTSEEDFNLSVTEKLICDNVIKYFGCYSGKTLSSFIENEPPIINAKISDKKNISIDELKKYFENIISKYKMISPLDMHLYADEKFELI